MTIYNVPATVEHVVDGDGLVATLDLGWHTKREREPIRLERIDAPELTTDAGKAAKAFLVELLPPGTTITVSSRKLDRWRRTLAAVLLADGRDLSTVLVEAGMAKLWAGPKP